MFPKERQEKLDPILSALRSIPGIAEVVQDDYDSNCIDVHLDLAIPDRTNPKRVLQFREPLRKTTNSIRRALKKVQCNIGLSPKMTYSRSPRVGHLPAEKIKEGYDRTSISLSIYV